MMNVLNGGAHADNSVDFQEFMVVPAGAPSFAEGAADRHRGLPRAQGDPERARASPPRSATRAASPPTCESNEAALEVLVAGIEAAGYAPGEDVFIALDPATSEIYSRRAPTTSTHEGRTLSRRASWPPTGPTRRPLPDRLDRGRHGRGGLGRLEALTERIGDRCQLVGDDLFVTNPERLRRGIEAGVANSILIKVNQIGTLTETLEAIRIAREAGYTAVMSHRSGETEDTTIADLAVATGGGPDQDRRAVALRPRRQVQPAAADRGGARRERATYPGLERSAGR